MKRIAQRVASQWLRAQFLEAVFERQADLSKRLMSRMMADVSDDGGWPVFRKHLGTS